MDRIAVKIGSNVLTRADGSLDHTRISALVDQVCELLDGGSEVIIISSASTKTKATKKEKNRNKKRKTT